MGSLAGLLGLAVVTACGSSDYRYVTNEGERTYFRVPASWTELDSRVLRQVWADETPDSYTQTRLDGNRWIVAYDADPAPDLLHVFAPATSPVVLAIIEELSPERGASLSLDDMRNSFSMVSSQELRDQATQYWANRGIEYKTELLDDVMLSTTSDAVQGIRVIYTVKEGNKPLEAHDLTVFVSDDRTKLYTFLLRCAWECYASRFGELSEIAESFTVLGRNS